MNEAKARITVGISACLVGQAVRYDGEDKKDAAILDEFAPFFRWISICPEVEIGMGIPREPIQLVQIEGEVRLRGARSEHDWTERMTGYAEVRAAWLAKIGVAGFVFKSRSPSCGLQTVPLYGTEPDSDSAPEPGAGDEGTPAIVNRRDGLFAAAIRKQIPGLPIRDETELDDHAARVAFLDEVRRYAAQTRKEP